MSFIAFLFNIGLMWYLWRMSEEYFEYEEKFQGWLCLFVSALNGAGALNYLVS